MYRGMNKARKRLDSDEDTCTEETWLLLDEDVSAGFVSNEGLVSSCVSFLCDPNHRPYRYTIAIFIAMVEGILTYCCQFPTGIQSTIIKVMRLDNTYYDLFFSAYTWPDIVMSILGTVLIDRYIGTRLGIVIFTGIVLMGQAVVTIGAYMNVFMIMLIGRLSIGCGMGTALSLTSSYLVTWFSGHEVTFIFSVSRCFHRLYATFALFSPQLIYESLNGVLPSPAYRHGTTQLVCTLACFVTVLCGAAAALLDFRGAKIIGRKPFKKKFRVIDILTFSSYYWILALSCSLYFAILVAYTANAPLFYISKFGMTSDGANLANSFSYLGIVFVTPFMGILIDVVGYNLVWGVIGLFFAMSSITVTIICTGDDWFAPYLAAFLCSMSFTFFGSALWVAVGYLVAKHQLTTAYGIMLSLYAMIMTIINVCFGAIVDHMGYLVLGVFCIALLFLILLLTVYLSVLEVANGNRVLNVLGKLRKK